MRRIATFLALPTADRLLALEALSTLVAVRVALPLVAIERLRAWAGRVKPMPRPVEKPVERPIERIVWAVGAASRLLPRTTCLASALTLQRVLSKEGHGSDLHIGVAKQGEKFSAHAWLACEGRILVGEVEHGRFTQLVAWKAVGDRGPTVAGKPDAA
ncbi:MAG: lasso peptide biosynthesis B2 protein [Rhodospirillales bacterium]|nr:lasso peptide biosynthesis B2 protein [Rhodospirillales bacterium]